MTAHSIMHIYACLVTLHSHSNFKGLTSNKFIKAASLCSNVDSRGGEISQPICPASKQARPQKESQT